MILNPDHPLWLTLAFIIGACVGSFLNVVIYRVPRDLSVNKPARSFCPGCKANIPARWNIPIVSWLLLRGKCRGCGGKIAFHYVFVEILTALLFLAAWASFPPAEAVLLWVFISLAVPILWIDAEHMIIPTQLTWAGSIVGLIGAVFAGGLVSLSAGYDPDWTARLLRSGLGWGGGFAALGAIVLIGKALFGKFQLNFDEPTDWHLQEPKDETEELKFVIDGESTDWGDIFYRKSDRLKMQASELFIDGKSVNFDSLSITRETIETNSETFRIEDITSARGKATEVIVPREAMGSGDPHLLAMIGAFLGYQSLLLVIMGSCFTALLAAVATKVGLGKALPYGPFLIAGAVIWIIGGHQLWDWYYTWARSF